MCGVKFFSYKIKFIFLISLVGNFGYKMRIKGHLFKQISFFSSSVNFASSQLSLQSTKTIFFPSEPKPPFTTLASSCSFSSQNWNHHLQGWLNFTSSSRLHPGQSPSPLPFSWSIIIIIAPPLLRCEQCLAPMSSVPGSGGLPCNIIFTPLSLPSFGCSQLSVPPYICQRPFFLLPVLDRLCSCNPGTRAVAVA